MELLKKYNKRGSWYTDYPPLGLWEQKVSDEEYKTALTEFSVSSGDKPVFLYIHYPFCPKQCYYCMCFSEVSRSHKKSQEFLNHNGREVDMLNKLFEKNSFKPNIRKIHYGGGSPSWLNQEEFDILDEQVSRLADKSNLEEIAIEVDPRTVTPEMMRHYHEKGINRISFGVQDFDPEVQKAINRIQPYEMVERLMSPEMRKLFNRGFNFDIIYGMPKQTVESFRKTIQQCIELSPDRLGVCILGWRPDIFKHQQKINESDLPNFEESTEMQLESMEMLLAAGYERIGIDHYAKPDEDLAVTKRQDKLHRSAMGYNPGDCVDMIGLGPSAMNRMQNYYFQKEYNIRRYNELVDAGKFPVFRGYKLNKDEQIRRDIMEKIICYDRIDFDEIEKRYGINFKEHFEYELNSFGELIQDGIIELSDRELTVTPTGTLFHRHVCTVFDELLRKGKGYKHARDSA